MKNTMQKSKYSIIIWGITLFILVCVCFIIFMIIKQNSLLTKNPKYIDKLFDDSYVHTIKIKMSDKDWEKMKQTALEKEYFDCDIEIDGELFENVAIRTKGHSTLKAINSLGNNHYGFKVEFDHNNKDNLYYGLDKIVLNSFVFDNAFVKDYISYDMMRFIGVPSPYTSYSKVYVNNINMGLYLTIEAIEESFLKRNYGKNYGELYKVDYTGGKNEMIYKGDNFNDYQELFDRAKTILSERDKKRLIDTIKEINTSNETGKGMDVDEIIKMFVVDTFLCHYDSYMGIFSHNYYIYEKNKKIEIIPWDFDGIYHFEYINTDIISCENIEFLQTNMLIDNPLILRDEDNTRILWSNIINNEKYKEKYHKYYLEFLKGYFDSGYFEKKMNDTYNMIYPYLKDDQDEFHSTEEFVNSFNWLRQKMIDRVGSIKKQITEKFSDEDKQPIYNILDSGMPSNIKHIR